MTPTSLRTVTLKTVANYRHAAERTLRAYRSGGQRLIAVVRDGVDQAAQRGAEPYVPGLAAALRRAGDNLGSLAHQGLDALSERSSRAIAVGADGVSSQLQRMADLADGVDNKLVASSLQAAVRLSLPGAQVALALSERVASGADKLAEVAAGAQATKTAKAAGKRLRRAKAEATEVVTETVAEAKTQAKTAARRGKAQAAKLVDAAVQATAKPAKPAKAVKAVKAQAKTAAAKPQAKTAVKAAVKAEAPAAKPAARVRRKPAAVVAAAPEATQTVAAA